MCALFIVGMQDIDMRHQAERDDRRTGNRTNSHVVIDGHASRKRLVAHDYVLRNSLALERFYQSDEVLSDPIERTGKIDVSDFHADLAYWPFLSG